MILCFILTVTLASCCGTHIDTSYSYKDTTIVRIDRCGKTVFYYGEKGNSNQIWTEYSGINDGFKGYLQFEENGKVILLSGDGYFQSSTETDTAVFEYKRISAIERPEGKENVYLVKLSTRYEREDNFNKSTKVKATYND